MSLYRASFSRRLIWYKTNHDYPLLLKDYMVNKIRICYYSWSQTKQKKHFNIRLMKNQKKKSKVSPTIILIKMTFILFLLIYIPYTGKYSSPCYFHSFRPSCLWANWGLSALYWLKLYIKIKTLSWWIQDRTKMFVSREGWY